MRPCCYDMRGASIAAGVRRSLEALVFPVYRLQGPLQVCHVVVPKALEAGSRKGAPILYGEADGLQACIASAPHWVTFVFRDRVRPFCMGKLTACKQAFSQ